jgi:glycosidase
MDANMLRFLENHDEERIANPVFAGNPWLAVPGMIVTATLNIGPVMIYSGQEVGEPAGHSMGFSSDTRTSIFDYCGVPEHQKWLNNGNYDGGLLSEDQKKLRGFYSKLLNVTRSSDALRIGKFYELLVANEHQPGFNTRLYIYLRYTDNQRVLVVANFNRNEQNITIKLPDDLLNQLTISGAVQFTDLLSDTKYTSNNIVEGVNISLPATGGLLLEF